MIRINRNKSHISSGCEIFEETVFEYDVLKQRLREMAFLTKGLKIILQDLREEEIREHTFHYEGGIKDLSLI